MYFRTESYLLKKQRKHFSALFLYAAIAAVPFLSWSEAARAEPVHGIAMHGSPKYKSDFKHFSYVNPDAPKGGHVTYAKFGSFDSLNPLIIKGIAAENLRGFVFESLMARSYEEPFSLYGLIARRIETPEDRSWVAFYLDPRAKFSDGAPISLEDVIFSWKTLRDNGRPNHRSYYSKVDRVETQGNDVIKFIFKNADDLEMPLIMALMPIMPKHRYDNGRFDIANLKTPLGSGPYTVSSLKPGASITYQRNPDYWGNDLPVNKGHYNFDKVTYDYFRDSNSMFEAFKKGLYHMRREGDPARWALGYDFPAVRDGRIIKDEIAAKTPSGMSAFVFNTRRPIFADIKVRQALILMFDFEWVNAHLFHGLYTRTQSFFDRSELSSHNRPASAYERELLKPYMEFVSPEILEGTYAFPKHDGSGRNRKTMRRALALLKQAGYKVQKGVMRHAKSGKPLTFEILALTRTQERLAQNFIRSLERIGVRARVRLIDSAQYQRRRQVYDFDMIQNRWFASLSPGNEQSFRWSTKAATTDGTFNYAGVGNKAVDAMIKAVLGATTRGKITDAVRALDRVLLSGHYVIPLFHKQHQWYASWKQIKHPAKSSLYGNIPATWWHAGDKK